MVLMVKKTFPVLLLFFVSLFIMSCQENSVGLAIESDAAICKDTDLAYCYEYDFYDHYDPGAPEAKTECLNPVQGGYVIRTYKKSGYSYFGIDACSPDRTRLYEYFCNADAVMQMVGVHCWDSCQGLGTKTNPGRCQPAHYVCDYQAKQCRLRSGFAKDECSSYEDCTSSVCDNYQCIRSDTPGQHECSTDIDCGAVPHLECQNYQCKKVIGAPQENSCEVIEDCCTFDSIPITHDEALDYRPLVQQLSDGSYLTLFYSAFRDDDLTYIYSSSSKDGGATWEYPPHRIVKDRPVSFDFIQDTRGKVVLFYKGAGEADMPLYTLTSDDNGKTWNEPMLVAPTDGQSAKWPHAVLEKDGYYYLVYSRGVPYSTDIVMVKSRSQWSLSEWTDPVTIPTEGATKCGYIGPAHEMHNTQLFFYGGKFYFACIGSNPAGAGNIESINIYESSDALDWKLSYSVDSDGYSDDFFSLNALLYQGAKPVLLFYHTGSHHNDWEYLMKSSDGWWPSQTVEQGCFSEKRYTDINVLPDNRIISVYNAAYNDNGDIMFKEMGELFFVQSSS